MLVQFFSFFLFFSGAKVEGWRKIAILEDLFSKSFVRSGGGGLGDRAYEFCGRSSVGLARPSLRFNGVRIHPQNEKIIISRTFPFFFKLSHDEYFRIQIQKSLRNVVIRASLFFYSKTFAIGSTTQCLFQMSWRFIRGMILE